MSKGPFLCAFALLLGGCGYTFAGGALRGPLRGIKRLSIPVFKNTSREPGLQAVLTTALRQIVLDGGRVKLVSRPRAQAVLEGHIKSFTRGAISFPRALSGETLRIGQYGLTLWLDVTLRRASDNKILLQARNLTLTGAHLSGATVLDGEANKNRAVGRMAIELMRRVYRLVVEAF